MNDHFRVAASAEDMAEALQFLAEFLKVIDLAIKNDPRRPFLVRHRLVAAFEIYDREPSKAKPQRAIEIIALIIRTAMTHGPRHDLHFSPLNRLLMKKVQFSANSA